MFFFGSSSEAIKLCPLISLFQSKKECETKVCIVGDHAEVVAKVMDAFDLKPDYILTDISEVQNYYDFTVTTLKKVKAIIQSEKPHLVLVQGDTTTAFVTALASYYLHIPIGHIEAGVRTNAQTPLFPTSFNRQAIDSLSTYHFAPTRKARFNLINEGKNLATIYVTGNTSVDALKRTVIDHFSHPLISWIGDSRFVLLTLMHLTDSQEIIPIFKALNRILSDDPHIKCLCILSNRIRNPDTLISIIKDQHRARFQPVMSVVDFHNFLYRSYLNLTDSQSIQEEASTLGKPVLICKEDQYTDEMKAGVMEIVGTNEEEIYKRSMILLTNATKYKEMSKGTTIYGDGYASNRIADIIRTGRRWEWNDQNSRFMGFTDRGRKKSIHHF